MKMERYHVPKRVPVRIYTQSGKVGLDLWPDDQKSIGVPPLIIHNLYVKVESDWAKTVVCIVPTSFYTQSDKLDLWPHNKKSIGFLLSSWTTCMWSLKVIQRKIFTMVEYLLRWTLLKFFNPFFGEFVSWSSPRQLDKSPAHWFKRRRS